MLADFINGGGAGRQDPVRVRTVLGGDCVHRRYGCTRAVSVAVAASLWFPVDSRCAFAFSARARSGRSILARKPRTWRTNSSPGSTSRPAPASSGSPHVARVPHGSIRVRFSRGWQARSSRDPPVRV